MGMFDSLYDTENNEWQTKAFACNLDVYRIGDAVRPGTFQVEILGDPTPNQFVDSYATITDGVLHSVDVARDQSLPLIDYGGRTIEASV